jgi:transposase
MRRYGLRDDQWDRIKDLLPGREGHVGGTAEDNRLFVEAVLYRFRTGCPWRDLPERFGSWKTVHQRFSRWAKGGVFERIFKLLAEDHDNEYVMIDATIVRAHQYSAGARAIGRSRGGPSTKIHALTDAVGNPCALVMVIEDLHWIDSESAEALGKIVDGEAKLRLLLLTTRRPEYVPLWLERPVITNLRLERLPTGDVRRLVQTRLGVDILPDALTRQVADKADGNPLFAEEIVSYLTERGSAPRETLLDS